MDITYIGHSGFLLETEDSLLLFDYYEGELPRLSHDKDFYVFASHRHHDHFNPEIFELAGQYPRVRYILSDDIWQNRIPEGLREQSVRLKPRTVLSVSADGTFFVTPLSGTVFSGNAPSETAFSETLLTQNASRLTVITLKSTDEGVAFLVRTGGHTIYHAGDLNDWRWEGEPADLNRLMAEHYREYLEPIRNLPVDAAFLPLDPRQEGNYCLGMDYFLELTDTKTIFPMHCWEDYTIIDRWISEHPDSPYKDRVVKITRRGEHFSL